MAVFAPGLKFTYYVEIVKVGVVRGVFRIQSNIYDEAFLRKLFSKTIFAKKVHRRCSSGF